MTGARGSYNSDHNPRFEAELEKWPPHIVWRKNRRGVMVAVEVRDPHAERGYDAHLERMRENADRMEREEARHAQESMEAEARLIAAQLNRERFNNSPLAAAARTSI